MKTVTVLSMWMLLGLAACGSEASDREGLDATGLAPAVGAEQADCAPADSCDASGPLFCTTAGDGCYLLYPNQKAVPVVCIAAPTRSPKRFCP